MRAQLLVPMMAHVALAAALSLPLNSRATCPAGSDYPTGPGTISTYGLVPISKSSPDTAYGYVPVGVVTPGDMCTIVDLKIPDEVNGELTLLKTCTLSFSFPTAEQAAPKKLTFSGPGHFTFTGYLTGFGGDESTTYNKQPLPGPSPPSPPPVMVPGNTYTIANLPCLILPLSGGQTVSGALCSDDTALEWQQTTADGEGGCPVGFFVVIS
ncbi:hypothetical protein GQ53DRAFT_775861 [Thozetella sp. PMI_491]|nr:hypothetical protein GQ53DRAFT_775861 [Thozetella sp. PMI_491]